MKTKSKKLNEIFGDIPQSTWNQQASELAANIGWIRNSQKVAIEILELLDSSKMSQKELANIMNVTPQVVNKWLRGKENFTFETIDKLEKALGIQLMHIQGPSTVSSITTITEELSFIESYEVPECFPMTKSSGNQRGTRVIKMSNFKYNQYSIAN